MWPITFSQSGWGWKNFRIIPGAVAVAVAVPVPVAETEAPAS